MIKVFSFVAVAGVTGVVAVVDEVDVADVVVDAKVLVGGVDVAVIAVPASAVALLCSVQQAKVIKRA